MPNPFRYAWIVSLTVAIATGAHAVEAVKIKPVVSVYADGKGGSLSQPEGVGCDAKSLVVADTGNGRLLQYAYTGGSVSPGAEISLPQVTYPIKVGIDSKGEIFTLDGKLRRIARVAPSGEFKGYLEISGLPGNGTVVPRSFRIDKKDNLYLLDVFGKRVLVLGPSGAYQREIALPGNSGFFSDLAVDASGNVFLIDSTKATVFSAQANSAAAGPLSDSLKEYLNFPTGIDVDNRGNLFVADQNGGVIVVLGQDGSFRGQQLRMGWKEGFLRYPGQMCINVDGHIFIADRGNNRIQIFTIVR